MKFSSALLPAVSLLAASSSSSVQAAPTASDDQNGSGVGGNVPLRIMPLGASITFGIGSTDGNGYRAKLRDLLKKDGNTAVTYVGSKSNGTMDNNDNEGWSGYRILPIFDKARESVPDTLPNVVLINAGTNECFQREEGTWLNAKDNTKEMIEWLWENSPNSTVVLSTLLVNNDKDVEVQGCLKYINEELAELVEEEQEKDNKVVLADMRSLSGPRPGDMVDDTHPGDVGYGKMAKVWFKAMQEAAEKDWFVEPLDPVYGDNGRKEDSDEDEDEDDETGDVDDDGDKDEDGDDDDDDDTSEEAGNDESGNDDDSSEEETESEDTAQAAATEDDDTDSAAASLRGTMSLFSLVAVGTLAFITA